MSSSGAGFSELVFSDLARFRPGQRGWLRVVKLSMSEPGMIASVILRAQQCLFRSGHQRLAMWLRPVGNMLIGADFGPGMTIGRGLWMPHPVGVTIGYGLVIGDNVTLAGGVTCAARHYTPQQGAQDFPTIEDGAIIGAHAVLVGGVRIGKDAMVGANSVVLSDVDASTVVMGNPVRKVGMREPSELTAGEGRKELHDSPG